MTDLTVKEQNELMNTIKSKNIHEYLLRFLSKYEEAKRGGIHDFIEASMYRMITLSFDNIDEYLKDGMNSINATEIMVIILDSFQKTLDSLRKNIETMPQVNFK